MREITVQKNDAGQRLDKFLSKAVKGLPQSLMYKYIRTKKIKVNRARAEQNQILGEGDVILLFIKDEFFESPQNDTSSLASIKPKLRVLYEDDNLLLVDKRPGILVHEDKEGKDNTLILHIQSYLYQKGEYRPENEQSFAPALCNRIDRNTGGIVISAKNAQALRAMNEMIRDDRISKFYLCIAHGKMPRACDELHGYLKKNASENLVRVEDREFPGSKSIITRYKVIDEKNDDRSVLSLLEIELVTGRTHQIRAHLAHIGHPLMGDGKYGVNREDRTEGFKYQALYAYRLLFCGYPDDDPDPNHHFFDYLKGSSVSVNPNDIWFTDTFNSEKIKNLNCHERYPRREET